MEQQNEPSAPQQVLNISQVPMEDNKTLKDAYSTTAAAILGVFQIIIGVVSFFGKTMTFKFIALIFNFSVGGLGSVIFCVSGGIAIGGARTGNKCLVVAIEYLGSSNSF